MEWYNWIIIGVPFFLIPGDSNDSSPFATCVAFVDQGIDGFVINYFFRAIVKLLQSKGRYQRWSNGGPVVKLRLGYSSLYQTWLENVP